MNQKGNQFGTFTGVFTPSILTILGVIMFLRAGFVNGHAGIWAAMLILILSQSISVLTSISMSAIATNTPVKGGGAYFLISRTLGPEFGGAIGIALYLAQTLSVPFYIMGFTEAIVQSIPAWSEYYFWIALGTTVVMFLVTYIGASWALKTQVLVLCVLALSIITFMTGAITHFSPVLLRTNLMANPNPGAPGFWALFAIYFPAVTGILAGINMSGDLKNPSRSLVRGTMYAMAVGFFVYLVEIILCGGSQTREQLISAPFQTMLDHAPLGMSGFIIAGVLAATLSSALGSFVAAPRVLQAIGKDRLLPGIRIFGRGTADRNEPRPAILLTFAFSLIVIFMVRGQDSVKAFDLVAALVAEFFLCTYGMINLAAFVESFGANPSFRPTFKLYHWSSALLGTLACLGVMFLIDPTTSVVALVSLTILYIIIRRREYKSGFGDARRGFLFSLVRRALVQLSSMQSDQKNWRPTFLVLSGNPDNRRPLVQYAIWLEGGRGIISLATLLIGDPKEIAARKETARKNIEKLNDELNVDIFAEVVTARDMDEGLSVLIQSHSIGPIKPNTILLGWPGDVERVKPFIHHLTNISIMKRSIVCVVDRGLPESEQSSRRRIDIWWRGRENGSLMLIMAHLMKKNWSWSRAKVRVLRAVKDPAGEEPAREALQSIIAAARIEAEAKVVHLTDSFSAALHRESKDASVVFMGFKTPEDEFDHYFYNHMNQMLQGLPTTLLVQSSGEADLLA